MKKCIMTIMLLAMCTMLFVGCGRVIPGEEGFLVHNWGDEKSNIETVGVGLHWYNPITTDLRKFPMQLQNISWETSDRPDMGAFSWNDKEGMLFQADIGIAYRVKPGASGDIFMKYRKGLDEVTAIDMKNRLQDAFNECGSKREAKDIFGAGKTDFMKDVQTRLQADFEGLFIIEKISLKSEMILPPKVKTGIEAQIAATQKAQQRQNEIAEAEAARLKRKEDTDAEAYDILTKAQSEAKSISVIQEQLAKSPEYIEYLKAMKWDGKLPVYTNGVPMLKLAQ